MTKPTTTDDPVPGVDFSAFAQSLAVVALRLMTTPEEGGEGVNLPEAQQHIEILRMLRDKTRGNLSADEERMLQKLIYDLQVRYVALTNKT
ncbi:MAG: hypothetical protein GMKNLPBB_00202 [Myxococcota bacterium]|nr:hypothetical protein [Myxococcota bacterium]